MVKRATPARLKPLRVIDMPLLTLLRLGMAMYRRTRRSLVYDQATLVHALRPRPYASGLANIPRSGSFLLVANHYQDAHLWIGWTGCLLGYIINRVRPGSDPAVHWVVTSSYTMTINGVERDVPLARWAFGAVAHTYDMILHEFNADRKQHATALRKIMRLLHGEQPAVVGFFPEGTAGDLHGLREALPGTGVFMMRLARGGIPIIPCGVWRDTTGRMYARFGPAVRLDVPEGDSDRRDAEARRIVMSALAALLPPHLRGEFAATPVAAGSDG